MDRKSYAVSLFSHPLLSRNNLIQTNFRQNFLALETSFKMNHRIFFFSFLLVAASIIGMTPQAFSTCLDLVLFDAKVEKGLTSELAKEAFAANKASLSQCRDKSMRMANDLVGKVVMKIKVGRDGNVEKATISSSGLRHAVVENCFVEAIKKWHLPRPTKADITEIIYDFDFIPIPPKGCQ